MSPQSTNDGEVRAEVRIEGHVQGVFFRASTRQKAQSLGLSGYVRNCRDGSVEAVFEGPEKQVRRAVSWCHKGSSRARVESVEADWTEPKGEFSDFSVRY